MSRRVATVHVHVPTEDGPVVLAPGDVIPEKLHKLVGAHVYEEQQVEGPDEAELQRQRDAATKAAADAKAEAEKAEAAAREAQAAQGAPSTPPTGTDEGSGTPAAPTGPDTAYDASTEPEHPAGYPERSHRSLQVAAKARGLKGDGDKDTLVARLTADDRDRANQ